MTVPAETNSFEYAGDGTKNAWSFPIYFLSNLDLKVIRRNADGTEATLTYATDYTVSGAGNLSGGTVTPVHTTTVGATYVIYRDPPVTQTQTLQNGSALPAASIIRSLDKLTMISARLKERVNSDHAAANAAETAARIAADITLAGMITGGGDFETLVAELVTAFSQREQYYLAEKVTYLPMAPLSHAGGTPGISLKYSTGWITGNKVHRVIKPTIGILQSMTFEGAGGGSGGGTSGPAGSEPSTGPGGAGGGYVYRTIDAADLPTEFVMVSGRGGLAGGWDKTVTYPGGADTQGWIMDVGAGGNGGPSALIDAADWNVLGLNDSARLTAFLALSEEARVALSILYCGPGIAAPAINIAENTEGSGGLAYGGDINRAGNDGAGGGYWTPSSDPFYVANGIYGGGGACGSRLNNDGLWETSPMGIDGLIGQVAGRGGTPKKSQGNHDGAWGSDLGGGGAGGQASAAQSNRVMPGGMGGQGGWRVICNYSV